MGSGLLVALRFSVDVALSADSVGDAVRIARADVGVSVMRAEAVGEGVVMRFASASDVGVSEPGGASLVPRASAHPVTARSSSQHAAPTTRQPPRPIFHPMLCALRSERQTYMSSTSRSIVAADGTGVGSSMMAVIVPKMSVSYRMPICLGPRWPRAWSELSGTGATESV